MKKLTTDEFINKAKEIHGDKYDYSLVDYKNQETKITIICPIHNEFNQRPDHHLKGHHCKKCSTKSANNIERLKVFPNTFIDKSNLIHNFKYDYSKVEYVNSKKPVIIICPKHGEFLQSPDSHLRGHNCLKCSTIENSDNQRWTNDEFIIKSKEIHGDKYDYSLINYIGNKQKINIICSKHGIFSQTPFNHLMGKGCSSCVNLINSKGQKETEEFFKINNIHYKRQKSFDDCRNPQTNRKLFFDFYLIDLNICVEYDGQQHFTPHWGGIQGLIDTQKRDKIKNDYCYIKNITLIRISYNENIFEKLKHLIKRDS